MAATTTARLRLSPSQFLPEYEALESFIEADSPESEEGWTNYKPPTKTLARIIYLLVDPEIGRVGSLTKLAESTQISRASLTRILTLAKAGKAIHPTDQTFIRLNKFLNSLNPPLIDPEDRVRRPIVFDDWYSLKRFHNSTQVGGQAHSSGADRIIHKLLHLTPQQQKKVEHYIDQINRESEQQSSLYKADSALEKEQQQEILMAAINNLARLIMDNSARLKTNLPGLAERLAEGDAQDAARILNGLELIIRGTLPDDALLLSELARLLETANGKGFDGDVEALLDYCGFKTNNCFQHLT